MSCCDKCDAQQIPPVLGGTDCWDANCECHKASHRIRELELLRKIEALVMERDKLRADVVRAQNIVDGLPEALVLRERLELIANIAAGSRTINSLSHIAKIARGGDPAEPRAD